MNDESNGKGHADGAELLPWEKCELFCIQDYAGAGASRCGWRGNRQAARHDDTGTRLLCPRCGSASLLRIPAGQ